MNCLLDLICRIRKSNWNSIQKINKISDKILLIRWKRRWRMMIWIRLTIGMLTIIWQVQYKWSVGHLDSSSPVNSSSFNNLVEELAVVQAVYKIWHVPQETKITRMYFLWAHTTTTVHNNQFLHNNIKIQIKNLKITNSYVQSPRRNK